MKHLISITGAGPGNPDLLTVKAYKRLANADVVLYDALPGDEILDIAPPRAKLIYVGKIACDGQNQTDRQNAINRLMHQFADMGKKIVRLKGGDPMIFGRGAEEIQFCLDNGLNYEVIPGISAAMAASAEFDIPLTERHKSPMVLLYTATRTNTGFNNLKCAVEVLKSGAALSVYMGLNKLPEFIEALSEEGIPASTAVNILSKVSHKEKEMLSGNLANIGQLLKQHKPATPAVIIIGKYAQVLKSRESSLNVPEHASKHEAYSSEISIPASLKSSQKPGYDFVTTMGLLT